MSAGKSKSADQVLVEDARVKVRTYKAIGDADQEFVFCGYPRGAGEICGDQGQHP